MTFAVKVLFFISSFTPVYAMIAALSWSVNRQLAYICLGLIVFSVVLYFVIENAYASDVEVPLKVYSVKPRSENVFMYIIAYLPPFFSVDYAKNGDLVALSIFYIMFFVIYVRLGMYYLNPIFVMRGLRAYEVVNDGGRYFTALVHESFRLYPGMRVRYRDVGEFIIIGSELDDDQLGKELGVYERSQRGTSATRRAGRRRAERSKL
jgi:hypothetical protein